MTKFKIEKHSSKIIVSGELTRHSINIKNHTNISDYLVGNDVIDLSAVSKIDTAGLAWLLSIVEQHKSISGTLHFTHLSGELVKLAQLSGVDTFLPTHH